MNQPLVGQSAKKKFSQFLSATLAFTTTVSLSGFALMFALTASAQVATLSDGDVVKTAGNPDVYIVTTNPHGQYAGWKRLILNPAVFNLYGHLSWSKIKTVNQATIDSYHTSALVRGENDPKVYVLAPNGDVGTKTWITSEAEFLAAGYSWSQIAQVNNKERDMYTDASSQPVVTPVSGSGLSVSLASNTAAAGSIVADTTSGDGAQAQASMLTANFAAGNDGAVTVTTVKVKRNGISADADIANAYLYEGANRIAEMTNISSTYISFVNAAGLFTVAQGTSKAITVKMDLTNGTTAGKTIALSINAASDVVAGSAAVSGSFPVMGNSMTTATVGDLGKLTIANVSPSAATTVDPQNGYEVWRFSVQATDQKVSVSRIKVTNVGSIATTDLANIKLMDGSVQLGSTAATLAVDGTATFDMSANPLMVTAGQTKNLSVVADIVGGTNRTYRFSIQRSADIVAMDTNYGVYVKPDQTDSYTIDQAGGATTINYGSLTISVDPASPNGNVAAGYTDQELARFQFKASGEAVKVTSLTATSTTNPTFVGLNNAKLYLDGTQVGATADLGAGTGATFTFGNSFIVAAGATRTLVVKSEVKKAAGTSFAAGNTIQVSLVAGSSNAQGQTSMQSISTSAANANTLTVQTGALTVAANSGLANATATLPTGVKGAVNAKIGSFLITAGSGEGVEVSQIVVKNSATAGLALGHDFQNLTLKNGSNQIGTTVGALSTSASNTYTFTPAGAINLTAGQQYVVDVYADILTGASNAGASAYVAVILDSVTATGKSTNSDASDTTTDPNGQQVYIATTGTLTVATASDMPIAQNRAMGQTGQTLATFKLTTGAQEAVNISKIIVTDALTGTSSAATGSVTNLSLWRADGTQVGSTVASMTSSTTGIHAVATFNGLTLNLAKDKAEVLTLKGDINSYPNAVSGSYHTFSINGNADATVTGATSGQSIAMTGAAATGNVQRAYRAELTIANALSNFSGGAGTDQNIAKYRFTNTSSGNYSITVTDIDLGLSTTQTGALTATRYVTLKRDATNGTTVAKTSSRPTGTLITNTGAHFADISAWSVTTGNTGEQAFSSFTIDASNGTGYVDIYVLADTNEMTSTKTLSSSIGAGSLVVTWSDGVSSNITTVDGTAVNGATVTY